ncbi:CYFA0S02e04918g1_1 [Cyberlindnera fabianii]|uniref:CYFA0S02e04918g1_1 n=1 Tax=Cyberlindnera fabianii TaxID=36022 RepID=A0A061AM88_CYBFA|nr:CYFA0S02e04918g1_1 [Cyberlindnera fabianii]
MEEPSIPKTTLSRLLQTIIFENEDTRITEQTLDLSAEYLRTFIREAVLRANEARESGVQATTSDGEPAADVLDVQHLEEIAGMLVLDF